MRVLVYQVGTSIVARLVDYDLRMVGKTYDDALYNLQASMAKHIAECDAAGKHDVWVPTPVVESSYVTSWEKGEPQIYAEYVFRLGSSRIEVPFLDVRISDE